MNLQELLARLQSDGAGALSDEELVFVHEALRAVPETVDLDNPTAEDITALETANDALTAVQAEADTRHAAVEERQARAEALLAAISPQAEAEAEAAASGDTVAASAITRPSLAAIARRVPSRSRPQPRRTTATVITASAAAPGVSPGDAIDGEQLDRLVCDAMRRSEGKGIQVPVATISTTFPTDRVLSPDDAARNSQLTAITAAGGPCAPVDVDYSIGVIGTNQRPLQAALPQFQGSRGGVRFQQPPALGDYDDGVSVWTQETDASEGALAGTTTKPCVRIDCKDEEVVKTEALPVCGTIGNWIARNYDERVQAFRTLLGVTAARFAESRHLAAIDTGSTQWSAGQLLGSARDVLAALDRAIAATTDVYRMGDNEALSVLLPRWLRRQMRVDVLRQLPGDSTVAVADEVINRWISALGVTPHWLLDETGGATFDPPANGAIPPWPSTVKIRLFPSGSWKHLDDGVLDLSVSGPYRDSELNKTNDAQIWMETFENVYFQGVWSATLTLDTCPSGATSSTVELDPCTTGS